MNSSNQTCSNKGNKKIIIYQLLPRLFSNTNDHCVYNGTITQNGCGKMNHITPKVLQNIKQLGATHVWYTGVIEHATKTDYSQFGITPDNPHIVKGNAGSPYAIKDYYDIDPDIATDVPNRMAEFEELVSRTHLSGLKVLIDFVPNHVARQYHSDSKPAGIDDLGKEDNKEMAFSPSNNFYYITRQLFSPSVNLGSGKDAYYEFPAKATGNDCFSAFPGSYDWYETVKLNYGVDYSNHSCHFSPIPSTWYKMLHILRFWAGKGIDGFRCDMAHMVPIEFWKWAIAQVKEKFPNIIFIAELYDTCIYRQYIFDAGFDYLYDKVNLYDTLRAIQCHNVSAATITNCWQRVDGIGQYMLNFLENHDEQRLASNHYLGNPKAAIPSAIVSATINKGPFMIYAGQELGEPATDAEGFSGFDGRTSIFDYWSIPTLRRWYNNGNCNARRLTANEKELRKFYSILLNSVNCYKSLANGDFFDLMYVNYENPYFNPHRQYAYFRHLDDEIMLILVNFDTIAVKLKINIPVHAFNVIKMQRGIYDYIDILSGNTGKITIDDSVPSELELTPLSGVILKLKLPISKKRSQ